MKLFGSLLVFACLLVGPTYGQAQFAPPRVAIGGITGPVDFGEMVILSADYDSSHPPAGLDTIRFNWTVLDEGKRKNVFETDNGQKIAFAVGMRPRHITVILDVNCLFTKKEKLKVGDQEREVVTQAEMVSPDPIFADVQVGIGPPPPGPTPPPAPPGPPPAPVFPSGQFGLAKFAYDTFTADTTLSSPQKATVAKALAEGFEGIVSKIVAVPTYTDIGVIFADTTTTNRTKVMATGVDYAKTAPLKDAIHQQISSLYHTKKLVTVSDVAQAWRELAQGLRAVQ